MVCIACPPPFHPLLDLSLTPHTHLVLQMPPPPPLTSTPSPGTPQHPRVAPSSQWKHSRGLASDTLAPPRMRRSRRGPPPRRTPPSSAGTGPGLSMADITIPDMDVDIEVDDHPCMPLDPLVRGHGGLGCDKSRVPSCIPYRPPSPCLTTKRHTFACSLCGTHIWTAPLRKSP
jgi:hypothetical protein